MWSMINTLKNNKAYHNQMAETTDKEKILAAGEKEYTLHSQE